MANHRRAKTHNTSIHIKRKYKKRNKSYYNKKNSKKKQKKNYKCFDATREKIENKQFEQLDKKSDFKEKYKFTEYKIIKTL